MRVNGYFYVLQHITSLSLIQHPLYGALPALSIFALEKHSQKEKCRSGAKLLPYGSRPALNDYICPPGRQG